MTDADDIDLGFYDRKIDEALGRLDKERRKVDELGKVWNEKSAVQSKDRSFSMTFDGRGDLIGLTFQGNKYRTLAPAELAQMIVDTLQTGRLQALQRMADVMHSESRPDFDFVGMATGKIDPQKAIDDLIGPMFDEIGMSDTSRQRDRG